MIRRPPIDTVILPPVLIGPHGRAWKSDLDAARKRFQATEDATLDVWIIEAPWAHPLWHSYDLTLLHLRPMPDGRKTLRYRADASHELLLHALNPDVPRDPVIAGAANPSWLLPCNFASQLVEPSDDDAGNRIENAARLICHGMLNPDTDAIGQWIERFGDFMMLDRSGGRA